LTLRPSAAAARRPVITGGGGVTFWSAAAAFGGVNDHNAQYLSRGLYFQLGLSSII
jgi:hypothetical protein